MKTIDATNKKLGRLASEIAVVLRGKENVFYAKNLMPSSKVEVLNASKISISLQKMKGKAMEVYSGYPGGLSLKTIENRIAKKGYGEVIKNAVSGMLPKNKLRTKMLLNLTIKE